MIKINFISNKKNTVSETVFSLFNIFILIVCLIGYWDTSLIKKSIRRCKVIKNGIYDIIFNKKLCFITKKISFFY